MSTPTRDRLPVVVTSLLRGVVYRDGAEAVWRDLLALEAPARDFLRTLGLEVVVDEGEGYAYVRSLDDAARDAVAPGIPRLVPRRELGFEVSLLLALLRRRLAQQDAEGGDTRLVLERAELVDMLRVFLVTGDAAGSGGGTDGDDARFADRVEGLARRVADLGFLRPAGEGAWEVRRVLKALVDAQWLADLDARLADYLAHARRGVPADPEEVA